MTVKNPRSKKPCSRFSTGGLKPVNRTVQLIGVHCEGEVGRVVTGGAPALPGDSVAAKLAHINNVDDSLRRFLIFEPRGAPAGSVNLLVPPSRPEADAAFLVLQADQAHAMSGSNAMCVTTALLETGMVNMREPQTTVTLDTAAGIVTAEAECRNGKCERVSIAMPPAFVEELDMKIAAPKWGEIKADLCFGGVFYALVDAAQVGLTIEKQNARALAGAGMEIKKILNKKITPRHPQIPEIAGVAYVMFRARDPDGAVRTCTTMWPGRVDRSPCGTGSSANLAALHARGEAKPGDTLRSRSIIGGEFTVTFTATTQTANRTAIRCRISGRSWLYGTQTLTADPADPFARGFALSDGWGELG